jgi:hypothetical protein
MVSSMSGGLVLVLTAIAGTRAEYRCHHNIGQDYCEKVYTACAAPSSAACRAGRSARA